MLSLRRVEKSNWYSLIIFRNNLRRSWLNVKITCYEPCLLSIKNLGKQSMKVNLSNKLTKTSNSCNGTKRPWWRINGEKRLPTVTYNQPFRRCFLTLIGPLWRLSTKHWWTLKRLKLSGREELKVFYGLLSLSKRLNQW
uniref:Uncharacterized protein n=1 Tax=Opuntia streptacantha TaxID=393608 RepID=A0A7C9ARY9_OPUST